MAMKASDAMTPRVITTTSDSSILEALRLMLEHKISGLPVVDGKGTLVGMVTEGDFLRRGETSTERKRPRWLEFIASPNRLASEYTRAHGRKVEDVMTSAVYTVTEDAPLDEVVNLMEKHRVKRLPVMRGDQIVGIISRANLLHVLAGVVREVPPGPQTDEAIRSAVLAELDRQPWAPRQLIDVTVRNGAVELWGTIIAACQRDAARVAAENVPGVKSVRSHLVWVEPVSGMVISDPDEGGEAQAGGNAQAPQAVF
jgi:CBS domain-containing protein